MGPKKRGRASVTTKRKSKKTADDEEPPVKIQKEESFNSKLKRAIEDVKKTGEKKKTFKVDQQALRFAPSNLNPTVYEDFSCMLNQTNIGHNNNKYYVIQVISVAKSHAVYTRWGRVGESGADKFDSFVDVKDAIKGFEKKFKDKTKNDWAKRENFAPVHGKYTLLEMDEESDEDEVDSSLVKSDQTQLVKSLKCSLDLRTMLLIKLIFNDDMFVNQMSAMNLDVRKMPLGKISKTQIAKGLEVLIQIDEALKKKKNTELAQLSSTFYTLVPHNFGRSVPSVINSEEIVNQKKELMMTLSDIELTQSLQKQKSEAEINPLDDKYQKLQCQLETVDKKSSEFKTIVEYATACAQTRKGPILDVWRVDRSGEQQKFDTHTDIKNRKLLWHGTNVAVVAAILKAGLRIMPHSGGRVGRGIYFASEHQKSSWYVGIHYGMFEKEKNIGFMFLIEVALGKEKHILSDNSSLKAAPKGYDSVVARGQTEPDSRKDKMMKFGGNDVIVPLGKPVKQSDFNDSNFGQSEYLVYKESQARIRYLIKFSFA